MMLALTMVMENNKKDTHSLSLKTRAREYVANADHDDDDDEKAKPDLGKIYLPQEEGGRCQAGVCAAKRLLCHCHRHHFCHCHCQHCCHCHQNYRRHLLVPHHPEHYKDCVGSMSWDSLFKTNAMSK